MGFLPTPTILRFNLSITDHQTVGMPQGARVLHVAADYVGVGTANPIIEVWVHCDPDQPNEQRAFAVHGTGHHAPVDPAAHIGSVIHQLDRGRGVWHVFDLGPA